VVSSCNSGIGIGVAAIVASFGSSELQFNAESSWAGENQPNRAGNESAERNQDTLSLGKVKLDLIR
jgi:hypothetical protein